MAEPVHAATLAVVAGIPTSVLRHVLAPHPSLNQVWDPLVAAEPPPASSVNAAPEGLAGTTEGEPS